VVSIWDHHFTYPKTIQSSQTNEHKKNSCKLEVVIGVHYGFTNSHTKKPTKLYNLQRCQNPRIVPTSNFCINKLLNWKPNFPHHIKGILPAIARMLPHMENYAKCKTFGRTLWPPIPSWLLVDCTTWICTIPRN
jgi:hypothetical protein